MLLDALDGEGEEWREFGCRPGDEGCVVFGGTKEVCKCGEKRTVVAVGMLVGVLEESEYITEFEPRRVGLVVPMGRVLEQVEKGTGVKWGLVVCEKPPQGNE